VALSSHDRLLADRLERLYLAYGPETADTDPIMFLGRYSEPEDLEAVGWITSAFSYGRVETIQSNVERILAALGPRPASAIDRITDFSAFARDALAGFRHRFHSAADAAILLFVIAQARAESGSLRAFFESRLRAEDRDAGALLSRVVGKILRLDYRPVTGRRELPQSAPARFFFPDPAAGSACKRWNLYLRWMVRRDRLDFGLWPSIETRRLVIPTDTHIHLVARRLHLTRRKAADWRTAREITDRLARFDPEDPVRYDYALCRIGILGVCQSDLGRSRCDECVAVEACPSGRRRAHLRDSARGSRQTQILRFAQDDRTTGTTDDRKRERTPLPIDPITRSPDHPISVHPILQ
jgi:uncharacterized protein (TIGR02757 family)